MTLQFGLFVPQGWRMDLLGIADPVEAYETMTRVAQEAEALGYHSVWLFDHFHTVPTPTQEVTFECWTSTAALLATPGAYASGKWSPATVIANRHCWQRWPQLWIS